MKNKKILIIVGGGISAYKSLDLIRLLKKNNFDVRTILTKSGGQFVTPMSLLSLSGSKVYENLFDKQNEAEIDHISLSRWADLILIVPATANLISKLSQGKAEDLATTVILASNKDIVLVPAMNVRMWSHRATQENCKKLLTYGYKFFGPKEGLMACGEFGKGKMISPKKIFSEIKNYFHKRDVVKNKKFKALVTTGPTREYLDPVRFISNESSGKQGYEIALELSRLGIKTTLISGPTNINYNNEIKVKKVTSGKEMFDAVKRTLPTDIAVCSAAVSDFKPLTRKKQKIKKKLKLEEIKLEHNPDILEFLGKNNRYKPKLLVGFSAETENIINNSIEKMQNKLCDIMVANDVSKKGVGFNADFNEVIIIDKKGNTEKVKKSSKRFIASIVARKIMNSFLDIKKNLN